MLKRGAEEVVVPKGSTKSPDYPRLVQLLKVAERSGLYHSYPETYIGVVLIFGSKDRQANGALSNGYLS